MLYSFLLVLPAFGVMAQATESYSPLPAPLRKRQLMTCDQTYGNGSIPCGGTESRWCFNPNLGQTCCQLDRGFCDKGSYCAPVAGYCCFEGEDLATCAKNAGFNLPGAAIEIGRPMLTAPAEISRTFMVTPFLTAKPRPTPMGSPDTKAAFVTEPLKESIGDFPACHQAPASEAPVVVQISNTTVPTLLQLATSSSRPGPVPTSVSPVAQVSVAAGNNRKLARSIITIAIGSVCALLL
ncbi:hypothetical protein F4861DRAFT_3034 [Xylaria intraflava]|nr:hypothetical protein F4861DRAFT_3034 [Xylaria intraflava]